jgi:hypothetical protein
MSVRPHLDYARPYEQTSGTSIRPAPRYEPDLAALNSSTSPSPGLLSIRRGVAPAERSN